MGIDALFPDFIKVPIMGIIATVFVLSQAARRYPHVEWLRKFELPDRRTPEQKRRAERSGQIMAGIQMILLGLVIPPGYLILEVMFMSDPSTLEMVLVGSGSLLCIGFGITAIVKARH